MTTFDNRCHRPPVGWFCTREPGHDGPCAAVPTSFTLPVKHPAWCTQPFDHTGPCINKAMLALELLVVHGQPMNKDMKESLSSTRKADTTHVRSGIRRYIARTCEYGTAKGYERGNFLRPTGDGPHAEPTAADFERLTAYLRAMLDHGTLVLDAMEHHRSIDPNLVDVEGMKRAAYSADTDQSNAFPASGLPHLCGTAASLMMAIEQAIDCGLLPADPGRPWERVAAATASAPASPPPHK